MMEILRFELLRWFRTPAAWFLFALVQAILGIRFYLLLAEYLAEPGRYASIGISAYVMTRYYLVMAELFLILVPFLTMRLVSEEFRSGTIRLVLSSPIGMWSYVSGKFLAVLVCMLGLLVIGSLLPLGLYGGTNPDGGLLMSAMLGMTLLTAAMCAVGTLISTLCRVPVVTALATLAALFLLWTPHHAAGSEPGALGSILRYLSLPSHLAGFSTGLVSLADVAYFLIQTGLCLALACWRMDGLRTHHW